MTDRYAVIGNPIAHSKSPAIHARFARQTGQDIEYGRLLAPVDGFAQAVDAFRAEGGRGLNVTLPFKLDAFRYATARTARAEAAGAVNTLRFDGGAVLGDNTDGVGLVRDVEGRLGVALAGRSVLLLGAGGAARGAVLPMLEAGVARLTVANRTVARAAELAQAMAGHARGRIEACGFDDARGPFDLIVNATSGGLSGETPSLPAAAWSGVALAYDMVYAAAPTAFMRDALARGAARVSDGLGMLVEQAAESFFVWRAVRPDTAPVFAALREELSRPA